MNWHKMRVPWLRKETVEKLRKLGPEDLDKLGVIAELERGADGVYRAAALGKNLDPREGVRFAGNRMQFGLTQKEIRKVKKRLGKLLADVDKGRFAVR